MKRFAMKFATTLLTLSLLSTGASALTHTVVRGDTMWKLAVQYQVGTREIIQANPQVSNPDLIYPGQVLTIPELDKSVTAFENEVIRLVNEARAANGLQPLTANWELSRVARYLFKVHVDSIHAQRERLIYQPLNQLLPFAGIGQNRLRIHIIGEVIDKRPYLQPSVMRLLHVGTASDTGKISVVVA